MSVTEQIVDQTLALVRGDTSASSDWKQLVDICRRVHPDCPWDDLPTPHVQSDLHDTWEWLQKEVAEQPEAIGLYLGLDTLNMDYGKGTNIEFGASSECDSSSDSPEWVWDVTLEHGSRHLIRGLVGFQSVYSQLDWKKAFDLCDYVFFLGYSGMILAEVLESFTIPRTLMPVWGFHDGDMFTLGRYRNGTFTRLCA
jgi:hypothetical protein